MPRDQTCGAGVADAAVADAAVAGRHSINLSPDMLANIHGRLSILDRLAFASVFRQSRDAFKPEAPWLVLPGETLETVTLFSPADRRATAVRAMDPSLRGHAVLGSSGGWLVTADARARMHVVNPVTGEQRALPAITTIPCLEERFERSLFFVSELKPFVPGPPYDGVCEPHAMFYLVPGNMRRYLYRKVVLSAFHGGAAMLITDERFGVPAFATAEDAAWRLASSREGVEDAVHHDGRFYSVTCSGTVEVWERDAHAGNFTSAAVTPGIGNASGNTAWRRKYLVVVPGGRLMVVLKGWKRATRGCKRWSCSFKVLVLEGGQWKGTDDIGDAALFVGANESLYVSTRVHPELKPGHVYYTEDDLIHASPCDVYKGSSHYEHEDHRGVGVFCLKNGTVEDLEGLGQYPSWPPPAWFMPSIP